MRGKCAVKRIAGKTHGITPAHAGKTKTDEKAASACRDHPRACGENKIIATFTSCSAGSPPRMRGKGAAACPWSPQARITPACAGKTRLHGQKAPRSEDHPRVCGENGIDVSAWVHVAASPPRVRGKRGKSICPVFSFGITPACAGKTFAVNRL